VILVVLLTVMVEVELDEMVVVVVVQMPTFAAESRSVFGFGQPNCKSTIVIRPAQVISKSLMSTGRIMT
jgi:hypothetical protein